MTHRDHRNDWEPVPQERAAHERGWQDVLELLAEHGFDGLAQALQILFNEAMKLERSAVLDAAPYERTPRRRGHANGFKPKTRPDACWSAGAGRTADARRGVLSDGAGAWRAERAGIEGGRGRDVPARRLDA